MFDKNRLKSIRVGFGDKQEKIAEVLGITVALYRLKENGFRAFNEHETQLIIDYYQLNLEDINNIFFNFKVYTKETA